MPAPLPAPGRGSNLTLAQKQSGRLGPPEASPRALVVFVDGVGLGPRKAANPLAEVELPHLRALADGQPLVAPVAAGPTDYGRAPRRGLVALDATLGVPGLPQSATGQTTILTGRNAAALIGRHLGPFPGRELAPYLADGTLWHRVLAAGGRAALANAYPDAYLARVGNGTGRMGAWARSAYLAGVRLRGPADLHRGRGVSAFITNEGWRHRFDDPLAPDITPGQAGRGVGRLALRNHLTVFEFYATDIAGHRRDAAAARHYLEVLDAFVGAARGALAAGDVLLVVSDHGNVEDLSTRRHTSNPALGLWSGPVAARPLLALTDVAPALLAHLGVGALARSPTSSPVHSGTGS